MKITVIGTGYVGLVTGACLADVGNDVVCLDLDPVKIELLKNGGIPIYEPGLLDIVRRNAAAGRLHFTTDIERAAHFGTIQFIAVGTPPDEDGSADMQYVIAAARNIGKYLTDYKVVVNKSTVPVGAADAVKAAITKELSTRGINTPFSVVSNPEFLKEGAAVEDFMRPDRLIIGCSDKYAVQLMRQLYGPFNRNSDRIIEMDTRSAELTKYASNAMLATRISFMNELAGLAEAIGADVESVRRGMGADPRIGPSFLYAGMGYGGSCFPKDVKALKKTGINAGRPLKILEAVETVNCEQKNILFTKICTFFGNESKLDGKTIGIWGLSFKPNTDDLREAPSLQLIKKLLVAKCRIRAYDPIIKDELRVALYAEGLNSDFDQFITIVDSAWDAVSGADALAIVTEWKEFRAPDFIRLAKLLSSKVIFDGRNMYEPSLVTNGGLSYYGIGRTSTHSKDLP